MNPWIRRPLYAIGVPFVVVLVVLVSVLLFIAIIITTTCEAVYYNKPWREIWRKQTDGLR